MLLYFRKAVSKLVLGIGTLGTVEYGILKAEVERVAMR